MTPLIVYFLLIAVELLVFCFLGYALSIRFKHFMHTQAIQLQPRGKLQVWAAATDFAWQSIFANVTLMQYMEDVVMTREHQKRYSHIIRDLKTCKYPRLAEENSIQTEEIEEEVNVLRKYVECTICIANFSEGQEVIVMPKCKHVFHEDCVKRWVAVRLRCPNCNLELAPDSDYLL